MFSWWAASWSSEYVTVTWRVCSSWRRHQGGWLGVQSVECVCLWSTKSQCSFLSIISHDNNIWLILSKQFESSYDSSYFSSIKCQELALQRQASASASLFQLLSSVYCTAVHCTVGWIISVHYFKYYKIMHFVGFLYQQLLMCHSNGFNILRSYGQSWDSKLTSHVFFVVIDLIRAEISLDLFSTLCGNSAAHTWVKQLTLGLVIGFSTLNWLQHQACESKTCLEC